MRRLRLHDIVARIIHVAQEENQDRDFPKTRATLQATDKIVRLIQNNYRRRKIA